MSVRVFVRLWNQTPVLGQSRRNHPRMVTAHTASDLVNARDEHWSMRPHKLHSNKASNNIYNPRTGVWGLGSTAAGRRGVWGLGLLQGLGLGGGSGVWVRGPQGRGPAPNKGATHTWGRPRQHVPPAKFFGEALAFTVFLCFSCFEEQEQHLQSAEIMYISRNYVQLHISLGADAHRFHTLPGVSHA